MNPPHPEPAPDGLEQASRKRMDLQRSIENLSVNAIEIMALVDLYVEAELLRAQDRLISDLVKNRRAKITTVNGDKHKTTIAVYITNRELENLKAQTGQNGGNDAQRED